MNDTTETMPIAYVDMTLAQLRRELVDANDEYRRCEVELREARALAEQQAINASTALYGSLKNEPERTRFLTLALADDQDYQLAVEREAEWRGEVEAIRAEIQIRDDELSAQKLAQKDREIDLVGQKLAHDIARFEHHREREDGLMASLQKLRESLTDDDEVVSATVGRA